MSARLTTRDEVPIAEVSLGPTVAASAPAVVAPSPPPRATPAPEMSPPPRDPAVSPRPTAVPIPLAAGAITLIPVGAEDVRVRVTLPAGWATVGEGVVVKDGGTPPGGVSIGVWSAARVPTFPCRWAASAVAPAGQMATAAGQAQALSEWWGQVPGGWPNSNAPIAPLATRPEPARFAGRAAWSLGVLVVRDFDFDQCDGGQLMLWQTTDGQARVGAGQGEVHRLWVVDLDGTVLLLDAASFNATSAADQAELRSILDTIVIEP